MTNTVSLCNLSELPRNGALGFDPFNEGRDTVFVVDTIHGPVAYRDLCPHYGSTSLPWRKNAYLNSAADKIICAAHGAEFQINTGVCVSGPCVGQSLTPVPIKIAEDGFILASIHQ
ncbi:Rieske (2Fe-2S) protein [Arenicella xantha]|uniref:Nitrite reductase/ring-hydroxylating ferredoxin subunit n=1 Tax=Arenicella xantha TaxID=644221 RepID=A0A395JF45_9GAMM|nr:Rieske (2Fe-2S) protein [Arenicella xantha]RBP47178.1 nitrite reductase/ring-hydroxylating ferredoxin subunit [Arenicella xantha]